MASRRCDQCGRALAADAAFCDACGHRIGTPVLAYAVEEREQGREWRSSASLLGIPLVHACNGVADPKTGRTKPARGWIALGDQAYGVIFAMGSFAAAPIAIGGLAVGLLSFGGLAVGAAAFGGLAVGGIASGGIAAGLQASGGIAIGVWQASGGIAAGGGKLTGGLILRWW